MDFSVCSAAAGRTLRTVYNCTPSGGVKRAAAFALRDGRSWRRAAGKWLRGIMATRVADNRTVRTPSRALVIGGGIVGLATAFRLGQKLPDTEIRVIEKERAVGRHQSGTNSGGLHAGLYYKPGSTKARLTVRGIRQMVEFCQEHAIPHEICGKLVVATSEDELSRLRDLHQRGRQNGLEGIRMLGHAEMREIEPHVGGVAALRVPQEGIVDYGKVCEALASSIHGRVLTGAKAHGLRQTPGGWVVQTTAGDFETELLINCAGLHCDRVSEMAGLRREVRILPFRGEYYKIKAARRSLVRNLIYPVPGPTFPFLGVHFTRLIHGGIEAGPTAPLAFPRTGYPHTD